MIEREPELPLTRQAAVLKLSRSGLYYRPRPVGHGDGAAGRSGGDAADRRAASRLPVRGQPDGSRDVLRGESVAIGRQRVATLMRRMGIKALYRRPNTSKPAPGHKIHPYLLRCVALERPNQSLAC